MSKEDVKFTRSIYHFPVLGDQYNRLGNPVLLNNETFNSIGDAGNSKPSSHYVIVKSCTATTQNIGLTALPEFKFGYTSELYVKAKVDGGADRKYHAYQSVYGRVTPASTDTIIQLISGAIDLGIAISGGVREILKHIKSLMSFNGTLEEIDNQPIPMHHTGVLRVDEHLKGIAKEGGAATGRRSVLSDVDVRYVMDIFTEGYGKMLSARGLWFNFLALGQGERQRQLKVFKDYEKARESFVQRRQAGRLGFGEKMPNPILDSALSPWLMWAWERQFGQTSPPPDNRTITYPGEYAVRRHWFI
jgi:hypothetical protein